MYSLSLSMSICSSIILLFLFSPYSESQSNYGVNQIAYEFWSNPTLPSLTNITYEFCRPTICGRKGPVIRFPFRLKTQPVFCGLKGFELSCSSNNNTLLHLPSFNSSTNDFYVQEISYLDSSITITDPNETTCPVKTLFSINHTSFESPFLGIWDYYGWEIATLNCTEKIEQSSSLLEEVGTIGCISDDKNFVYVISAYTDMEDLPQNCSILSRSKRIPGLKNTVMDFLETGRMVMAWEALDGCHSCEKSGKFCGFNFTNNSTVCVKNKEKFKTWIWPVTAVAATLGITIILVILFLFFMRRRRAHFEEKFLLELMNEAKEIEIEGKKGFKLKVYSVSSIMDATNCFSDENKLGEGGYGPVYKGLFDGQEIAIKRLSRSSRQGLAEFKNELIIVAKLQHTNLVQLLGFCIQGEEKMLVYEFMPHNSLDSYIFDQSKRKLFNWNKYFYIIEEIAQGILYLHKYSRLRIIHRDLKASNILLDNNMNPKISDFGMARIFTTAQSEANTNRIVGTRGYMAPEYAVMGIFSTRSDVFSYGVLVLEIVSGRRSNSNFNFDRPLNLIGYAWMLWKEDAALEIMHPALRDSCSEDRVLRCINVALLCVEDNPLDRPSMADVISMLTTEGVELPKPKQPAFCIERRVAEVNSSTGGMVENHTINNLTVSVMTGR